MTIPMLKNLTRGMTLDEAETLLAALAACTKSGGGSPEYSLLGRLQTYTGVTPRLELICELQATAHREYVEGTS